MNRIVDPSDRFLNLSTDIDERRTGAVEAAADPHGA
jgi:hypothetical protein